MLALKTKEDLALLKETVELEFKLAQGRNGEGRVPDDFWLTYSAFANTRGGTVILGVRERNGTFEVAGVQAPDKLRSDLFNTLNNPQKVSENLLLDGDVTVQRIEGREIIVIEIPAASRKRRPVFINGNPMRGTFKRLNEGDRACDEDSIRRMMAERVDDSRDSRVLPKFGERDISLPTLRTYRQMLRDARADHPYLDYDDERFLRSIGGWRTDRESGESGLTVAGLLMFGEEQIIRDEFFFFTLDYQERPSAKSELRWVDRVTLDGTWSGNIFDFFRIVYRKLVSELRVPFALQDGQRKGETAVHVALREALVNALVHADYTGRASVLIVKRPDMFGFRNPGLMRVSIAQAIEGGESDGRNRLLQ